MPTTAQQSQLSLQFGLAHETLGSDEFASSNSPPMTPVQPEPEPQPSPPPEVSHTQLGFTFDPSGDPRNPRHPKNQPKSGDSFLISLLGNGQDPSITQEAGTRALSSVDGCDDLSDSGDCHYSPAHDRRRNLETNDLVEGRPRDNDAGKGVPATSPMGEGDEDSLQHLAAGALQRVEVAVDGHPAKSERPSATDLSRLSINDERPPLGAQDIQDTRRDRSDSRVNTKQRTTMLSSSSAGLPPIVSPGSESNGQSLPSIRSTLGDIKLPPPDQDLAALHSGSPYPHSPPAGVNQLPPLPGGHGSPPISPPDSYPRSLPSPRSLPGSSPYHTYSNAVPHRPSIDYSNNSPRETLIVEQTASGPLTSTSVTDRMSIDGITNPGAYVCKVTGCNAPPFQTQYLLNSHANVHSSARPHYCPVPGCSRSEGGKGFKRKNEMIRHGLVHESPGYVCPFCPERDHKYPRPDNLQRHVRVHHLDKSKDDPLLREVLSQRAEGPNRGRRRRGTSS